MRALSPRVLKRLREFVYTAPAEDEDEQDFLVAALDFALTPKRSSAPAKKRRVEKNATRREKTKAIRAEVMERALGRCECCGGTTALFGALDLDHAFGGANKRALESVETCWALDRHCHRDKTENRPSAAYWLGRFIAHAERHGYADAAKTAQARLDALELQGRAG